MASDYAKLEYTNIDEIRLAYALDYVFNVVDKVNMSIATVVHKAKTQTLSIEAGGKNAYSELLKVKSAVDAEFRFNGKLTSLTDKEAKMRTKEDAKSGNDTRTSSIR